MSADPVRGGGRRLIAAVLVVALAAIITLIIYSRHESGGLADQNAYVPRQTKITPAVELLQQYIRIDTSNPPGNELPAAQWLAKLLQSGGVHAEIFESAPRRAAVYARLKGKQSGQGLLLLHHMDVVPADGKVGWTRPPFSAEIYLNQLYGRGSIDMKGIGICELLAFLDVARSGRQPERDIVFLGVPDEESGSDQGMRWIVEHRPDVLAGVRYALNEGGITEMLQERVTYFGIEVGTKLNVLLKLRAPSRQKLQEARIALEPWFIMRVPERITPEVREWMRDLAPQRIDFRRHLEDIDRTIAEGKFWEIPVGYHEMTQNNVFADGIARHGNEWEMVTHLLDLPDTNPDERIEWLRREVAPFGVEVGQIIHKEEAVPVITSHTPFFELLSREAKREFHQTAVGTEILNRSYNDSRFLRRLGINAYGISPYPVDFFQTETIHNADERIRVDYFNQGVEFLRHVVTAYAFPE